MSHLGDSQGGGLLQDLKFLSDRGSALTASTAMSLEFRKR